MVLYEPVHARLCRFVQTLVWDKEEAKDVVSETILLTYENLGRLKDEKALPAYMFSVAANLVNKKLRRSKFMGLFDSSLQAQRPASDASDSSLMLYELNRALRKLPQKQREAIVWYEVSGLDMDQIAGLHRMSVEGVKSNIHRARKTLARWLERNGDVSANVKGVWYDR